MAAVGRHIRITGRVQGVFFRAWTRDAAQALAVSGWVRNCPDGSVEAHVEGDDAEVEQLINRLREGPPGARVDDLTVRDTAAGQFNGFVVRP